MLDYFRQYTVAGVFGGGPELAAHNNDLLEALVTKTIFRRHHDLDNISVF
jgi:hypothetical protein